MTGLESLLAGNALIGSAILGGVGSAVGAIGEVGAARMEGRQARVAADQQAANAMLEGRRERGAMLAQQAAGGGRAGTGTGMELLAESASIARHNALIARYHGTVGRRQARSRAIGGALGGGLGVAQSAFGAVAAQNQLNLMRRNVQ